MRVAFIIILYKTPEDEVSRLKKEIISLGFEDLEIYFIDNSENNLGYAKAVNVGIKKGLKDDRDLFILANPDISLKDQKAKDLLGGARHFDIWGFAMWMHGKTYYGGVIDQLSFTGGLNEVKPMKRFSRVSWISGSLMCIKKETIKRIGFFDESFFMYYEDVDFCLRARKAGLMVGLDNETDYEHYESSRMHPKKNILLTSAQKIFFRKHANIVHKIYELIKSNSFHVSFFSLNFSSLFGKILSFVLFITLIRFLKPQDYGVYTLVWAQVTFFSPLGDLGTTSYGVVHLPIEKKTSFVTLFNVRFFSSIAVLLLTVLSAILLFSNNKTLLFFIFLTSFVVISNNFSGNYLIHNATGEKLYRSALITGIFNAVLIFILVAEVIIFRSVIPIFFTYFVLYNLYSLINYELLRKDFGNYRFSFDLVRWKSLIKKSYIFVLIGFFAGLYFKLDVFLLQLLKGERDVGIYSAGYKFLEASLLFASSYNIAGTPVFAKLAKVNRKLLFDRMKSHLKLLSLMGFVISFSFFFLAPHALPLFMKKEYSLSIDVARIVILALPLILISSVFLNVLYVLKKASVVIFIFIFQSVINFALNLFLIPRYSYIASSYLTVFSEVVNVLLLFLIFKRLKNEYFA